MIKNRILQIALSAVSWGSALAGFSSQATGSLPETLPTAQNRRASVEPLTFEPPTDRNRGEQVAAHSSHASHASHYSGSGAAAPSQKTPDSQTTQPQTPAQTGPGTNAAAAGAGSQQFIAVLRVQAELRDKGYYNGLIDGQLGATTTDAVKRFQLVKGLPATGGLDQATLAALGVAH